MLMDTRPLFERNFIFPFAIACKTKDQAQSLHPSLTKTLISLGLPYSHNDPLAFATRIFESQDIDRFEFPSQTKWYPLIRKEIPVIRTIYMQHR